MQKFVPRYHVGIFRISCPASFHIKVASEATCMWRLSVTIYSIKFIMHLIKYEVLASALKFYWASAASNVCVLAHKIIYIHIYMLALTNICGWIHLWAPRRYWKLTMFTSSELIFRPLVICLGEFLHLRIQFFHPSLVIWSRFWLTESIFALFVVRSGVIFTS